MREKAIAADEGLDGVVEKPLALAILERDAGALRWIPGFAQAAECPPGKGRLPALLQLCRGTGSRVRRPPARRARARARR